MTQWGAVRVLHVKVNANLRALTREELEDRRKNVVVNMLDVVAKDIRRELHERVHSEQFRQRASGYDVVLVRMSVVLPAMMPEQLLDYDAKILFAGVLSECIDRKRYEYARKQASLFDFERKRIDDEVENADFQDTYESIYQEWLTGTVFYFRVGLGEPEAVAAGTMLPVTVEFANIWDAEEAAAEGLAGDKVKAALEAAGFGAAHLVAPAAVETAELYVVSMSVVLEQQLDYKTDYDARKRLEDCIAAAAGVHYGHVELGSWRHQCYELGEAEVVAAGTMLPVTVKFYGIEEAEKAAAEGLAEDRVKAALEAAGFGAAHLVAPASVNTFFSQEDQEYHDFVGSIVKESEARVRVYKAKPGAWFTHNNSRLAKAVSDGLALPLLARAKFDLCLHSDPEQEKHGG
jgi:hypothetical protein